MSRDDISFQREFRKVLSLNDGFPLSLKQKQLGELKISRKQTEKKKRKKEGVPQGSVLEPQFVLIYTCNVFSNTLCYLLIQSLRSSNILPLKDFSAHTLAPSLQLFNSFP